MRIVAVANQKGGVGKSAIATHLALRAAEGGSTVIVVDLDGQGTCTHNLMGDVPVDACAAHELFSAKATSGEPCKTAYDKVSLFPFSRELNAIEEKTAAAEQQLRIKLTALTGYDLCVIDTPPFLGRRLRAALRAADGVLTPFEAARESIDGIVDLVRTIEEIRAEDNPRLEHIGLLANRVTPHSVMEEQMLDALRDQVGDLLLPCVVYQRAGIRAALAGMRPVWRTLRGEARSHAALEMRAAMDLVLRRLK